MEKKYLFLLLLLLTVGFASVNTYLDINGKVDMSLLESDLDVVFKEVLLNKEKSDNTIIIENGKSFIYSANDLTSENKTSNIDYVVMNRSHQYDVEVTVSCTTDYETYLNYNGTFDNNKLPLEKGILIEAGEVKSGNIITELISENTSEESLVLKCTLNYIPVSRETILEDEEYLVTLDSGYEEKLSDIKVKYYEEYSRLPDLKRTNYKFLGWYTEEDIKVDNNSLVKIKGNHTLKAKWEEAIYDLNIVTVKNGVSKTKMMSIPYGATISISINEKNYYISKIKCSEGYIIEDYNLVIPTYGEQKPNIKNNWIEKSGTCTFTLEQGIFEYNYTGSEQEFSVPLNGKYKVELWGASGSPERFYSVIKSGGSYTSGEINLIKNTKFYVYVGEKSATYDHTNTDYTKLTFAGTKNAFNGGGKGNRQCGDGSYYGGISIAAGATDIRTIDGNWNDITSLRSRIMVAAASGGTTYNTNGTDSVGGPGGGLTGYNGTRQSYGTGATQVSGGSVNGSFGSGGNANWTAQACNTDEAAGGSGGWYGGGGAISTGSGTYASGGSGSSYISGHAGCIGVTSKTDTTPKCASNSTSIECSKSWTNYYFVNTVMIDGAGYKWTTKKEGYVGMPTHDGTGTMTGNSGNGYAKITYLG